MRTVSKQDLEKKINQKCTQVNAVLHTKVDYLFRRLTKVELGIIFSTCVRPKPRQTYHTLMSMKQLPLESVCICNVPNISPSRYVAFVFSIELMSIKKITNRMNRSYLPTNNAKNGVSVSHTLITD